MKKLIALVVLVALVSGALVLFGGKSALTGHATCDTLNAKCPAIFEWEEGGVKRCEMWYPLDRYYYSCAKGIPEESTRGFRRVNGAPPVELGFLPPPQHHESNK